MNDYNLIFNSVKQLNNYFKSQNIATNVQITNKSPNLFDEIVKDEKLRNVSRKLFMDGHHARAVEEAYKHVDNLVKSLAGLKHTELTGAKLMNHVFSANNPIIKFNDLLTTSEKDEQIGFMQILAGCMTGIRNPRAHETDWEDSENNALYMISFADYLVAKIKSVT